MRLLLNKIKNKSHKSYYLNLIIAVIMLIASFMFFIKSFNVVEPKYKLIDTKFIAEYPLEKSISKGIAYYISKGFLQGDLYYFVDISVGDKIETYKILATSVNKIKKGSSGKIKYFKSVYLDENTQKQIIKHMYEITIPHDSLINDYGVIDNKSILNSFKEIKGIW